MEFKPENPAEALDIIVPSPSNDLRSFVESHSGQKVLRCYQCGKCAAGCPVAYAMDLTPRQIIRAIQLGLKDEILKSSTIWLCVQCLTCSARCPQEIDIARIMESLRIMAIAEKIKPAQKDIEIFHRIFLDQVKSQGRVHEFMLAARYNLQSGHFFSNMERLPDMISKGKLAFLPSRIKGAGKVKDIFVKVKAIEEKS